MGAPRGTDPDSATTRFLAPALVLGAFLAPGAWLITRLPPVPVAKALVLATAALWLIAAGSRLLRTQAIDRRVRWGLLGIGAVIAASLLASGTIAEAVFYDLYADVPLVQWLAFVAVFVVAARSAWSEAEVRRALGAVVGAGAALAAVIAVQQVTSGHVWVFGSTGYSTTALVGLVPVGVALAATSQGRARIGWYAASAVIALGVGVLSGSTMGALGAVFAALVAVAAHPGLRGAHGAVPRVVRRVATGVAALLFAGLLVATVPLLNGGTVNAGSVGALDKNVVGRVHFWHGAQAMVADRPLLGFGPAGYRVAAVEYLPPEALQFGSDRPGDIDPVVSSPQSPHGLVWDIATRVGLLGLAAFLALGVTWLLAVRERSREAATADLRLPLAAGFAAGLFALLVNPARFAIGLVLPALAGLAVAPADPGGATARDRSALLAVSGVVLLGIALWLGAGEWRLYTTPLDDARASREASLSALSVLPGHPVATRRVLEADLLLAESSEDLSAARQAVDQAGPAVSRFAPNLVSLATYGLYQAERTGRSDVSWETALLDRAAGEIPPTPALVAERLHAAVLSGDVAAVETALVDARTWGGPYPFTADYVAQAEALLDEAR
jgi:hypothetical protein